MSMNVASSAVKEIDRHQYLREVAMSRVQLALNVNDIDEAVSFYTALFGTEPAKRRPGYANFAIAEPPLKLVLLENPGQGGTLNHLGVEVADADAVDAEQARLAQAGLAAVDERDTTCCYARQDKFWVTGAPGGERWEIYTVLEDSPTFWGQNDKQRWDAVQAELDGAPTGQTAQCCGGPQAASATGDAATGVCCV
jgi:catechol 2,3-dioxygenase-like lactoylglutathione lyase family enzyme